MVQIVIPLAIFQSVSLSSIRNLTPGKDYAMHFFEVGVATISLNKCMIVMHLVVYRRKKEKIWEARNAGQDSLSRQKCRPSIG